MQDFSRILVVFLSLFPVVFGYATGAGNCVHPMSPMASAPHDGTNGGYVLEGVPSSYTPGLGYLISLNSTTSNTFKGGIWYAVNATNYRGGSWTPYSILTQVSNLGCAGDFSNSLTHTTTLSGGPEQSAILGTWTAPNANTGTVMFQGVVVEVETTWYYLTPIPVTVNLPSTTGLVMTTGAATTASSTTGLPSVTTNAGTTQAAVATTEALTTEQANAATTASSTTSESHASSGNKLLVDILVLVSVIAMAC